MTDLEVALAQKLADAVALLQDVAGGQPRVDKLCSEAGWALQQARLKAADQLAEANTRRRKRGKK